MIWPLFLIVHILSSLLLFYKQISWKVNCSTFYGHIRLLLVRDGHWVGLIALTFFVPKTCVTLQCSSFYGHMSLRLFFVGIPLFQHLSPFPLLFWDIFGSLFSTQKQCALPNPYLSSRSQPSQNAINCQQHHILAITQHHWHSRLFQTVSNAFSIATTTASHENNSAPFLKLLRATQPQPTSLFVQAISASSEIRVFENPPYTTTQ